MLVQAITHFPTDFYTLLVPIRRDAHLPDRLSALAVETGLSPVMLAAEFKADFKETALFFTSEGAKVYLLGLGDKTGAGPLLHATRTLVHQQKKKLSAHLTLDVRTLPEAWIEPLVNGVLLGGYRLGLYKTDAPPTPELFGPEGTLEVLVGGSEEADRSTASLATAQATAETQLRIYDLMNAPASHKTPRTLVTWALDSADRYGYTARALDDGEIEEAGLHALRAVSRGSAHEPALLLLDYTPETYERTVGLVGKGVTFDTGGVSIKPSLNMHLMKSDMGGAAAVLGAIELAARLRLPVRLVGVVPVTENAIDGASMKPGDVIGSYSGKTIEVTDTDAEGRLILADGLTYCVRQYRPDVLLDLATLTGNCVAALGYHAAGLFSADDALAAALTRAGDAAGERLWRLPLWDEYKDHLDSDVADLRNYSGKPVAGAIAAAKFLQVFTDDHPAWAHLDIAGVAFGDTDFAPQRAGTAFGVRLLVEYLKNG
jgi:leucyl aminopeptidase